MDFKKRELKFGLKDKTKFNAEEVKEALANERFPNVELRAGPS
jgi:hypothetical protein